MFSFPAFQYFFLQLVQIAMPNPCRKLVNDYLTTIGNFFAIALLARKVRRLMIRSGALWIYPTIGVSRTFRNKWMEKPSGLFRWKAPAELPLGMYWEERDGIAKSL